MSPPAPRCPGQDMRYWTPDAIHEMRCPHCGAEIEIWKDEPVRVCRACRKRVRNPYLDMGCAEWCHYAEECLGALEEDAEPPAGEDGEPRDESERTQERFFRHGEEKDHEESA